MHELFLQTQYLPPGVQLRVKLYRKQPSFYLLTDDGNTSYRVNIQDARLITKFVKLTPAFQTQFDKIFSTKAATYTIYDATDVKTRQLQKGLQTFSIDNFFAGDKLPNRVVFALVDHFAYSGSFFRNPFNFATFGLEEILLSLDNNTYSYKIDQDNRKLHPFAQRHSHSHWGQELRI